MTTSRGNVLTIHLAIRMAAALVVTVLAVGSLSIGVAGAQSAGCTGGPYAGATSLDSDGDGVNDGVEVQAGTDECDPDSTPTSICGEWVANYNAGTADTDADGHTDADEVAAGSDPCDASSVVAAAAAATTTTTTAAATTTTTAATTAAADATAAPALALTGPSTSSMIAMIGLAMLMLGFAARAAGNRAEA